MDKCPEEVLFRILEYMPYLQIRKCLYLNRRLNCVLSRNSHRLQKIEVEMDFTATKTRRKKEELRFYIQSYELIDILRRHSLLRISMIIGTDRITIEPGPAPKSWKGIAEFLAWKTGSTVKKVMMGEFNQPALVIPLQKPQEVFFMLLEFIATKVKIDKINVTSNLSVEFRWKVWNCLELAGAKPKRIMFYGFVSNEELRYLYSTFDINRFGFNSKLITTTNSAKAQLTERTEYFNTDLVDSLLQYHHQFYFEKDTPYILERVESLYRPIKEWLMGVFDKFAVEFYAFYDLPVMNWIQDHFNGELLKNGWYYKVNFTIPRQRDGRWLWICGTIDPRPHGKGRWKYSFCDIGEDIRNYSMLDLRLLCSRKFAHILAY